MQILAEDAIIAEDAIKNLSVCVFPTLPSICPDPNPPLSPPLPHSHCHPYPCEIAYFSDKRKGVGCDTCYIRSIRSNKQCLAHAFHDNGGHSRQPCNDGYHKVFVF